MNPTPANSKVCESFLEDLTELVDDQIDAPMREAFVEHRAVCSRCASAYERRRLVLVALRALHRVEAPRVLDAHASTVADPGALVRASLLHVERLPAPAALDERVLAPSLRGTLPRRFVVLQRRRALQQFALAAVMLFGVITGAYKLAQSRTSALRDDEEILPPVVHERVNEVPILGQSMAELLLGGVPTGHKR